MLRAGVVGASSCACVNAVAFFGDGGGLPVGGLKDDLDACGVSAGFVRAGDDGVDVVRTREVATGVGRGFADVRELVGILDIERERGSCKCQVKKASRQDAFNNSPGVNSASQDRGFSWKNFPSFPEQSSTTSQTK